MFDDPKGPIEHFSWGTYIVCGKKHSKTDSGKKGKGKDIRLIGRDVSKWKERKGHELFPEMITGVYDNDIEVLVIGTGVHNQVQVSEEVIDSIKKHGIRKVVTVPTPEACEKYNALYADGKKVALLAHGTC